MPTVQVSPGPLPQISLGSGVSVNQPADNLGGAIISQLFGKYYNLARAGLVFHGATAAAGVLIPISTTTGPTFALWNPSNSGKNLVLIRYALGLISTLGAAGTVVYMIQTGVGSNIGTGAPITAVTTGTAQNGIVGGGANSIAKFVPGTVTLTTAGTLYDTPGFSQGANAPAAVINPIMFDDIDGRIILPPGTIWYTAGTAALLSTFFQGVSWAEVPT